MTQEDKKWIANHLREMKEELSSNVGINEQSEEIFDIAIAELEKPPCPAPPLDRFGWSAT